MSSAFRILFGCCFGKDKEDAEERRHLLDPNNGDPVSPIPVDPVARDDKPRSQEFKQRLEDLVQHGTSQLIIRSRATYSPVFPNPSSSNPNILGPSTSRPPNSSQTAVQRSQPESPRHSSQSSRHSSFRQQHPSLDPHLEREVGPSEDGTPALEALNPTLSLVAGGAIHPNYGTLSPALYGPPAPAVKFQIFRERPKSKSRGSGNNTDPNGVKNQVNGVLSPAGPHDEQKPENSLAPVADSSTTPSQSNATGDGGKALEPQRQVHFQLPKGDLILHYDD